MSARFPRERGTEGMIVSERARPRPRGRALLSLRSRGRNGLRDLRTKSLVWTGEARSWRASFLGRGKGATTNLMGAGTGMMGDGSKASVAARDGAGPYWRPGLNVGRMART
jgi:hypothetical protein